MAEGRVFLLQFVRCYAVSGCRIFCTQQTVQASFGLFDPHEEAKDAVLLLFRQSRLDAHLKLPGSALGSLAEAVANQVGSSCTSKRATSRD